MKKLLLLIPFFGWPAACAERQVQRISDTEFREVLTDVKQKNYTVNEFVEKLAQVKKDKEAILQRHALEVAPLDAQIADLDDLMRKAETAGVVFPRQAAPVVPNVKKKEK